MGELLFVSEDPTIKTSAYAARISQRRWQKHRPEIERLHEDGLTRREILRSISSDDFRPSFGQLVAQMTRWRLVRYSKLDQHGRLERDLSQQQGTATGILRMVASLVGTDDSATIDASSDSTLSFSVPPLTKNSGYAICDLLDELSLQEQQSSIPSCISHIPQNPQTHETQTQFARQLDFAEFCFLGASYHEAFELYSRLVTSLLTADPTERDEITLVQAICGCLRLAITDSQSRQACNFADSYSNNNALHNEQSTNNHPPEPQIHPPKSPEEMARIVLRVLTHLENSFSPLGPTNSSQVSTIIARQWLTLRLNRLPTWHAVAGDTQRTPLPQVENLVLTLHWAQTSVSDFGLLFDEQINKLWHYARASLQTWTHLLFWRFLFAVRQDTQVSCPQLRISLSSASTSELSMQETLAVLAGLVMANIDDIPPPIRAHQTLLDSVQQMLHQGDDASVMPRLWAVLHRTLNPTPSSIECAWQEFDV